MISFAKKFNNVNLYIVSNIIYNNEEDMRKKTGVLKKKKNIARRKDNLKICNIYRYMIRSYNETKEMYNNFSRSNLCLCKYLLEFGVLNCIWSLYATMNINLKLLWEKKNVNGVEEE